MTQPSLAPQGNLQVAQPSALTNAPTEPSYFWLRLCVVAALWIGLERLLALKAYRLVPASLGGSISFAQWMAAVEATAVCLGLGLAWLVLRAPGRLSLPTAALGRLAPSGLSWLHVLLLSPLVYVSAIYFGQQAALDTLLREIREGGRQLAQAGLGDFGRGLAASSLLATFLWVGVMAPISEELMFRGALWGAFQRGIEKLRGVAGPKPPSHELSADAKASADPESVRLSGSLIQDPAWLKPLRAAGRALLRGGFATLLVMLLFGAMHAEFDTGLGIIRIVSALTLGLCCGVARQASGGVVAPILLHAAFNCLSVATDQRWVVSETFPKWKLVPSLLVYVGGAGLLVSAVLWLVVRLLKPAPR